MLKLTDEQIAIFQNVGESICQSNNWQEVKRDGVRKLKDIIDNHQDAFVSGVTIGKYHFTLVIRAELKAIEVAKPVK